MTDLRSETGLGEIIHFIERHGLLG
jgi:hypothetical protein